MKIIAIAKSKNYDKFKFIFDSWTSAAVFIERLFECGEDVENVMITVEHNKAKEEE